MRGVRRSCVLWGALALVLCAPSLAHASALSPKSFDPGPDKYPRIHRIADVPITMRDGIKLYADVYLPADANGKPIKGRVPAVLSEVLFNKNAAGGDNSPLQNAERNAIGYTPLFMKHGYAQVIVDMRGTGSSEGKWDQFSRPMQDDGYEIARWLVRQPWSNGKFVGYGPSCMAANQIFLGARHPKGLKALFPMAALDDTYRDTVYHGGSLVVPFFAVWHGLVLADGTLPPSYSGRNPRQALLDEGSHARYNRSAYDVVTRPYDGPWWWERNPGRQVHRIKVPTFLTGGWFDLMQRGTPLDYNKLRLPPGRKKLLIGPWYHLTFGEGAGKPGTPPTPEVLALAWFDRWARGKRNGIEHYGPVTVQQLGTKRWQVYQHYPRRDVRYRRFFLGGARSGSARSLNDGSLTSRRPPQGGSDPMPGTTVNGLCTRGITQWSVSLVPPGQPCTSDHRSAEATSLTYTTTALKKPLHVSGPLSLTLRGSTTAHDAMWIATVSDVQPDGRSEELTSGWLMQSRRALNTARTKYAPNGDPVVPYHPFTKASVLPVKPGATDRMAIEIYNTDAVLKRGHRLRVTLSSGEIPHLAGPAGAILNSAGGTSTVHRGRGAQSWLTVPLAPLTPEPVAPAG